MRSTPALLESSRVVPFVSYPAIRRYAIYWLAWTAAGLFYFTQDLAPGENLVFAATGVTDGDLLHGVRFFGGGARTHSLVMAYQSKQVRFVDTVHMFDRSRPPAVRL